ncbi:hypothetical protein ABKV19_019163, partial [Rosa sericea]
DVVSAPIPSCPPIRRITATRDKEDNALESGLPSSHTIYTVCLSRYLLHCILSYAQNEEAYVKFAGFALVCLLVGLIGLVLRSLTLIWHGNAAYMVNQISCGSNESSSSLQQLSSDTVIEDVEEGVEEGRWTEKFFSR